MGPEKISQDFSDISNTTPEMPKDEEGNENLLRGIKKWENELSLYPEGSKARKAKQALAILQGELKRLESGYVGRKIPEHVSMAVVERDFGRDFGRPNHNCSKPGPPHHIVHYNESKFSKNGETPHTLENLEAPCNDCHKLAHVLNIPSGISIQTFFKKIPKQSWLEIEKLWSAQKISDLKRLAATPRF